MKTLIQFFSVLVTGLLIFAAQSSVFAAQEPSNVSTPRSTSVHDTSAACQSETSAFPLLAQSCVSSSQCPFGYHCKFGICQIDSGGGYGCQWDAQCTYPERCVNGSCRL